MIAALTADVRNDRWQSSHQHRIIRIPGAQHHERGDCRWWRRRCGWKGHISIPRSHGVRVWRMSCDGARL